MTMKYSTMLALVLATFATVSMAAESGVRGGEEMVSVEVDPEAQRHRELMSFSFTSLMYKLGGCKYPGEGKGALCKKCTRKDPRKTCKRFVCKSGKSTCDPPEDVTYCYGDKECIAAHCAYYGGDSCSSSNASGGDDADAVQGQNGGGGDNGGGDNGGGDNGGGDNGGGDNGGDNGGGNDNGGNNNGRNENNGNNVNVQGYDYYSYESATNSGGSSGGATGETGGTGRIDNAASSGSFSAFLYIAGAVAVAGIIGAVVYKARTHKKKGAMGVVLVDEEGGPKVAGVVTRRLELVKTVAAEREAAQTVFPPSTEVQMTDYRRA